MAKTKRTIVLHSPNHKGSSPYRNKARSLEDPFLISIMRTKYGSDTTKWPLIVLCY